MIRWIKVCTQAAPSPRRFLSWLGNYGGFLDSEVSDPIRRGQYLFTVNKGHAVAAMAAITRTLVTLGRKSYPTRAHTAAFSTAILAPSFRTFTLQ